MKDQIKPKIIIGRTNKLVSTQGYTYNESGLSYNQSGVQYGGLYGNDIYPLKMKLREYNNISPLSPTPPGANTGLLVGVLSLTYP